MRSAKTNKTRYGFTIVEVLIVIVVVGVLVAIATIAYPAIKNKSYQSSINSKLESTAKYLEIEKMKYGDYSDTLATLESRIGKIFESGITTTYYRRDRGFCLSGQKDAQTFRSTNYSSPKAGSCTGNNRDTYSQTKWSSWIVGSTAPSGYSNNGDGNSRVSDTDPWGKSSIVWDVSNQDATSDADGGWNSSSFTIDNTKMYRYSVFVRRKNIGDGSFYLGLYGNPNPVLNRSNGATNTNPYFTARSWWGNANEWYLVTGYVWPAGSGTGSYMPESGIYSLNGTKLISNTDYTWQATTTSATHRSYLFYSTNIATNQQFFQPRVDIVDGTEPSITELLNDVY